MKLITDYRIAEKDVNEWWVRSLNDDSYLVKYKEGGVWECSPKYCPAAKYGRRYTCKHIEYVKKHLKIPETIHGQYLLEVALDYYYRMQWSVIPVEFKGKRPLIKWETYQYRLPSVTEIRGWWSRFPNAGIGVVTGKLSGIFVIDVDMKGLSNEKLLDLTETRTHVTGRGLHYIYKYTDFEIRNTTNLVEGIDVRGEGGYIIVPPTLHTNGKKYWLRKKNIPIISPSKRLLEILRGHN